MDVYKNMEKSIKEALKKYPGTKRYIKMVLKRKVAKNILRG